MMRGAVTRAEGTERAEGRLVWRASSPAGDRVVATALFLGLVGATRPVLAQAPAPTSVATESAPVEVSVHGNKRSSDDVGAEALRTQDARSVPGTFGDPLQALATMPGVAPMASGLPYFYLRGAPPADTGYFVDGIPVPALFHIGPGPSYVPAGLLSRVELYPSTAPSQFGRFVGGIIEGELTAPAFGAPSRGEASVRLFDASAFVEAPVGDSWDVVAAGRYGYPNLLLGLVAPDLSLGYGDYTLRIAHRLGEHDTLSVFALGGYDHETDASDDLPPIDTQFHRIDVRFDHGWDGGSLRVATTFGYDRTAGADVSTSGQIDASTSSRVRLEIQQRFGSWLGVSAGADASVAHYAFAPSANGSTTAIGDEEMVGAFVTLRFALAPGIEISPGLRVDDTQRAALPGGSGITVDPRLQARVALGGGLSWLAAMGIAHQEPSYVVPIPGAIVTAPTGFQSVDQIAGGFEETLPTMQSLPWLDGVTAKLTAFYNTEHQVSDFIVSCGELLSCGPVGAANGRTYGVELLVRRDLAKHLGGWLAYTLSRAERFLGSVPYLSPFDRTHELSAVLHYDLGSGYSAGVRATYYTGRPDFPSIAFGNGQTAPEITFGPGEIAQHRLPAYYRLDWRFEKAWNLALSERTRASVSLVAEFFNTTLTKEALSFQCSVAGVTAGLCRAVSVGPIALPSVGLEGRW